jgi:hypothetical protein
MSASDAQGAEMRFCMEPGAAPHTFDASSEPYDPLYEDIRKVGRIVGGSTMRGTRSQSSERTRLGHYAVGGPVAFNISPADLDLWLPRMLGHVESSDSFALDETLPSFGILVDRVTQTFQYKDCMVDTWMIHGKAGPEEELNLLELRLDIMAKDEVTGTSYPTLTLPVTSNVAPYVISDCATLTLAGSARTMKEFWLIGRNFLQRRSTHSITATRLSPRDRLIKFRAIFPYDSDHSSLYGQALAGSAGTLTFTNSTISKSLSFVFGTLQSPDISPTVRGKQEINIMIDAVARKTGTTTELATTSTS